MITVKRLRELLSQLPDDAKCYAYEGVVSGVVVVEWKQPGVRNMANDQQLAFIEAERTHWDELEDTYTEGWGRGTTFGERRGDDE